MKIMRALLIVVSAAILTLCVCATSADQAVGESVSAAVAAGKVTVVFRGTGASSGDAIEMTVTKTAKAGPGDLVLTISPGTRLNSSSASVQSMVVGRVRGRALGGERFAPDSEIRLSSSDSVTYVLEAYCADFNKDNPSETVTFSLGPEDPVIACIVAQSGKLSVPTIQAAVWIHTGKVTYRAMNERFAVSNDEWAGAQSLVQNCEVQAGSKIGVPRSSMQATNSNSDQMLRVYSVPTGQDVYLIPRQLFPPLGPPRGDTTWFSGLDEEAGETAVTNNWSKYFVGKTPIDIGVRTEPSYVIVVADIDELSKKLSKKLKANWDELLQKQMFLDISANGFCMKLVKTKEGAALKGIGIGLIYKTGGEDKGYVTSLFQPIGLAMEKIDLMYPLARNFEFDDDVVKVILMKAGLGDKSIHKAIELLHRGGKIAFDRRGSPVVVQFVAQDRFEIISLHRK